MFCYLVFQISSSNSGFIQYKDGTNQTIIGCTKDYAGDVIILQTVTEIYSKGESNYAFQNCKENITSLNFEENSQIVSIHNFSFHNTNLLFANLSQCKLLYFLNGSLFFGCYKLKSIILPPNISSIENH